MRILGIDPGSRFLGYGIVEWQGSSLVAIDYGVLKMNPESLLSDRLLEVGQGLEQILQQFKPQQMSLEKIFLGKNADSAFKLGHARGVVIYQALKHQVPVFEYATREVKKGVTGHGGAEKDHVRLVVQNILKIGPVKSLDASDALAMACYHAQKIKLNRQGLTTSTRSTAARRGSGRATLAQIQKLKGL